MRPVGKPIHRAPPQPSGSFIGTRVQPLKNPGEELRSVGGEIVSTSSARMVHPTEVNGFDGELRLIGSLDRSGDSKLTVEPERVRPLRFLALRLAIELQEHDRDDAVPRDPDGPT